MQSAAAGKTPSRWDLGPRTALSILSVAIGLLVLLGQLPESSIGDTLRAVLLALTGTISLLAAGHGLKYVVNRLMAVRKASLGARLAAMDKTLQAHLKEREWLETYGKLAESSLGAEEPWPRVAVADPPASISPEAAMEELKSQIRRFKLLWKSCAIGLAVTVVAALPLLTAVARLSFSGLLAAYTILMLAAGVFGFGWIAAAIRLRHATEQFKPGGPLSVPQLHRRDAS